MTILHDQPPASPVSKSPRTASGHWRLQDAKARFSELVRRVRSDGPQRVTVHGRDEVVVVSAEDYERLLGATTGAALIAAMQASPHQDVELFAASVRSSVRSVDL